MKKINKIEMSLEEYENFELELRAKMIQEVLDENSKYGYFPTLPTMAIFISIPFLLTIGLEVYTIELNPFIQTILSIGFIIIVGLYFGIMINIYKQITRWGNKK